MGKVAPDAFKTFPDRLKSTADKPPEPEETSTPQPPKPTVEWTNACTRLALPKELNGLSGARAIHVVGDDILVADTGKSRILLLNDQAETKGAVLLEGCGKEEGSDLLRVMDAVPYGSGLLVMDTGRSRVSWMKERKKTELQPPTIFQPGGAHRPYAKLEGMKFPRSLATTPTGLWICDAWSHRLVRVPLLPAQLEDPAQLQETLLASAVTAVGGPEEKGIGLKFPHSVVVVPQDDETREVVIVSDANNHRLLKVTWQLPAAGSEDDGPQMEDAAAASPAGELAKVEVILGDGKPGLILSGPSGLAYDPSDKALYVADKDNARVLRVLDGKTTTVYGSPQPVGVALRERNGAKELLVTDLLANDIAVVKLA
jgi:sugar lactone lactonase YvrE